MKTLILIAVLIAIEFIIYGGFILASTPAVSVLIHLMILGVLMPIGNYLDGTPQNTTVAQDVAIYSSVYKNT